jgi:iron uptake system EfeUOB component EfeO/EfeM
MSQGFNTAVGIGVPVLAQLAVGTEASQAVYWIIGAVGVAAAANQLMAFWRNATGRFAEREGGTRYQTAEGSAKEHERLESKIELAFQRVENVLAALRDQNEERASKLHSRIDPISNRVTELAGRLDDHLADHRAGRV